MLIGQKKITAFVEWASELAGNWGGSQRPCLFDAWEEYASTGGHVLAAIVKDWYARTTPEERQQFFASCQGASFVESEKEMAEGKYGCLFDECTCGYIDGLDELEAVAEEAERAEEEQLPPGVKAKDVAHKRLLKAVQGDVTPTGRGIEPVTISKLATPLSKLLSEE